MLPEMDRQNASRTSPLKTTDRERYLKQYRDLFTLHHVYDAPTTALPTCINPRQRKDSCTRVGPCHSQFIVIGTL